MSNSEIPKANEIIAKYNKHTEFNEKDVRKLKSDNDNNGSGKPWLGLLPSWSMRRILDGICGTYII